MRPLTILGVAYPLAPVGADAVGGAEQVLAMLDRGLVERGHRSLVIAQEGSRVAGTLLPVPATSGPIDAAAQAAAQRRHAAAIAAALAAHPVDVVHLHGIDFTAYLPPPGPPVLATLHLPPGWYPDAAFRSGRPGTAVNFVSAAQRRASAREVQPPVVDAGIVENGVDLEAFAGRHAKRGFALALGRICPEKGFHLALAAARGAEVPLLLGGAVFDYPAHRQYFRREIVPRLDTRRRFLGPLGLRRKRRLLGAARCLVVPSLVEETSSLVAMEALAAGTPVVAFRRGALADLVEHGETGFLVDDPASLGAALRAASLLDPERCRAAARRRCDAARMIEAYLARYLWLTAGTRAGQIPF